MHISTIAIVFLFATSAFGQTSITDIPLDADISQCIENCGKKPQVDLCIEALLRKLESSDDGSAISLAECDNALLPTPVMVTVKKVEEKKIEKKKLVQQRTRVEDRKYVAEKVGKTIEAKNCDAEIEHLNKRINDLATAIASDVLVVKNDLEALKVKVADVERKNDETNARQDGDIADLQSALRLADLGRTLKVGPEVGFIGLYSLDGTTYSGGLLGVRASHSLMENVDLYVDGGALLSLGEAPFGARGGVGIRWDPPLTNDGGDDIAVGVDLGAHGAVVGLNGQLDGRTIFTTIDLGLFGRRDNVVLGVVLTGGGEFDQDSPAAAFGAGAVLRVEF